MATIFLQIRNDIQSVQVTELTNPIQPMVFVEFENGYGNIFFADAELGDWVEQDLGFTRLASLVGGQIKYVVSQIATLKRRLTWYEEYLGGHLYNFGFYGYRSGKELVYEIYASNRRYMFTAVKKGKNLWHILKLPGTAGWDYNAKYQEAVPYLLERHNSEKKR